MLVSCIVYRAMQINRVIRSDGRGESNMVETFLDARISYVLFGELEKYRDLFLKHCGQVVEYPRGADISISGTTGAVPHFLLSGMVKVYTVNPRGYVRILGFHRENSLFVMDRICLDEPAVVSTHAVTDIKTLRVTPEALEAMAQEDETLMHALLRYYGKVLRLMCFDAEVKSIGDVASRLASFLYLFSEKELQVRLTQEELAAAINASRVQVARILVHFQEGGLIESHRGMVAVCDRERLLEYI